jgi:hypothetical protein
MESINLFVYKPLAGEVVQFLTPSEDRGEVHVDPYVLSHPGPANRNPSGGAMPAPANALVHAYNDEALWEDDTNMRRLFLPCWFE